MGALGVAVGILTAIFVKEPKRGAFKAYDDQEDAIIGGDNHVQEVEEEEEELSPIENLKSGIIEVIRNPVVRYSTLAASLRYFGIFCNDYFLPAFFLQMYPSFKAEFSMLFGLIVAFGGFISTLSGGILADKFGMNPKVGFGKIAMIA